MLSLVMSHCIECLPPKVGQEKLVSAADAEILVVYMYMVLYNQREKKPWIKL